MNFQCNTCGDAVDELSFQELTREEGSCPTCGSTVRIRSLTHLLSEALHGKSLPTIDWPRTNQIVIGISDWHGFEKYLPPVCNYANTQFDHEAKRRFSI